MTSSDRTLYAMALGAGLAIVGFCLARADDVLRERIHIYAAVPAVVPTAPQPV